MSNQKVKFENPMPVIDDGWWASVLAEENRAALRATTPPPPVEVKQPPRPPAPETKESVFEKKGSSDWMHLRDLYMRDEIIALKVTGHNRGGLLVEGEGLYGFVPFSHLIELAGKMENEKRDHDLISYVGRTLHLKVIECAPEDGRVVFSERAAQSESGKRTQIFGSLQPGQIVQGAITNVTDFGVFVDLGGVEGLIHISELSWGRVSHPSSIVKIGTTIDVQVLDLSMERCRVALSLKRLQPNPWENAALQFPEGAVANATITSVLSFGAFARLNDFGIEGLIHASEIPQVDGGNLHIKELLTEGQNVQVRILHLDSAHQRMGLSMRIE
jgi:small subunit ribosomal protein S1